MDGKAPSHSMTAQQRLQQTSQHLSPTSLNLAPSSASKLSFELLSSPSSSSSPSLYSASSSAPDKCAEKPSTSTFPSDSSSSESQSQESGGVAKPKPSHPKHRLASSKKSSPPADWSDVLGQVKELQQNARRPPTTSPGYIRQKNSGKLWARERIEQLLDANSFWEIGSISGSINWIQKMNSVDSIESFVPSNNIQGLGRIEGRKVCVTADDFSLRAGHADGATKSRSQYLEQLCSKLRIPIIKLVDGSSGGGSVTTIRKDGFSYVPPLEGFREVTRQLELGIPNIAAIVGPAIGLGAARATACHFSVMAADVGALFNAGPWLVAKATFEEGLTAQELGGPETHCTNGTVDNTATDEKGCYEQIKRFLSYVPDCGQTSLPPVIVSNSSDPADRDCAELRTIIPRRRQRAYAMIKVISGIVDVASFFEIGAGWGATAIVGLARLTGRPVGIIANNPEVQSGATDAGGAQKMIRHLNLCDSFNLPVIQLIDCPGYAIGTTAERQATMRWGVQLGNTLYQTSMPIFSVIVRKCYGVAGALHVNCREPDFRIAWPSMETGSLPLEGGVEASHAAELNRAQDRDKLYTELYNDYRRLQNPVRTAAAFSIQEIIDPADTRKLLCAWTLHM